MDSNSCKVISASYILHKWINYPWDITKFYMLNMAHFHSMQTIKLSHMFEISWIHWLIAIRDAKLVVNRSFSKTLDRIKPSVDALFPVVSIRWLWARVWSELRWQTLLTFFLSCRFIEFPSDQDASQHFVSVFPFFTFAAAPSETSKFGCGAGKVCIREQAASGYSARGNFSGKKHCKTEEKSLTMILCFLLPAC
jgi:hypothetical protein